MVPSVQRSSVCADGYFSPTWQLEEAVELLAALLSVDTYERLVTEQGWQPEQPVRRIQELSGTFLRKPVARQPERRRNLTRKRGHARVDGKPQPPIMCAGCSEPWRGASTAV